MARKLPDWSTPRRSASPITQAELKKLVDNMPRAQGTIAHFNEVRVRLLGGAAVEPGEYEAVIEIDPWKYLSRSKLREAFGEEEAENIINRCNETPTRRLKIRKRRGKALGFRELGAAAPNRRAN